MTKPETPLVDDLNLSWPHSVNYHVDIAGPNASSPGGDREAGTLGTGSQKPVTTYNGAPREKIRNAQPLLSGDEIRVLDLTRGTHSMPLVGSLRKVRLSDKIAYEPLSYTWEDRDSVQPSDGNTSDDMHPTLILSDSDCSYLKITSNCAKALRSIRKSTADRVIWVDSICINQNDPEEKSHQLDLMEKIYPKAFTVLIYLGPESSEIDSSSRAAMTLLRQPDRLKQPSQLDHHEITSLKRLFARRYFKRMWIVQEVALARNLELHCGPDTSYVSDVAGKPLEAILGSQVTPAWLRHSRQRVAKKPRRRGTSQAEQILELLFDTALCDCTDERDRVFALFSLLETVGEERLKADCNLSTAQVYSGLAAYLTTNGLLWGVLMLAPRLALNNHSGLPSWVPGWKSLGQAGLHDGTLLRHIVAKSRRIGLQTVHGINSSGVITIRGILLGSVTNTECSKDNLFDHHVMDSDQRLTTDLFNREWRNGDSTKKLENTSIWALAKLNREESLGSWGCHFKFFTRCKQTRDVDHLAFMLPDSSTLLILRPHDSFRDQYTLVESGEPLVRLELPDDWKMDPDLHGPHRSRERMTDRRPGRDHHKDHDVFPHLHLRALQHMTDRQHSYWDTIPSTKEAFPRLAKFSQLWSHNPFTSTVSLTHKAIRELRRTPMTEFDLLQRWQTHARVGMQMLYDRTRVQQLIHEVNALQPEEYEERMKATELGQFWSLNDFLSLFIKNPRTTIPMEKPLVQLDRDQALGEMQELVVAAPDIDSVSQLMQWADVTRQVILLFEKGILSDFISQEQFMDTTLHNTALRVGRMQVQVANRSVTKGPTRFRDRTSFLLREISQQLSDVADSGLEQVREPHLNDNCYWDWGSFNSVLRQRFSFLDKILPDIEKIRANLGGFDPDVRVLAAHRALAAHGFNTRKIEYTDIHIR